MLGFIVSQCMENGSVRLTKNELAQHMECCVRTIDRAVRKLRDEGYIEVVVLYGEDGDIPLRILKTRPEFSEKSMGAFALPAKSSTNEEKAFSQVVSCFASDLRMRRISEFDCNCIGGMETQFLAKPVFGVSPVHSGALFQKSINGLAKAAW